MDRRTLIAGIALWAATPQFVAAQPGWILLGSRTVNWASGRDSIMVAGRPGPLSALSFGVRRGEIFIRNVDVVFARGGRQSIPVNARVRSNMGSTSVRLRGSPSDIRRIDFSFRRVSPGSSAGRTTVEVFGRR
jgi:hypothetical protein